MHLISAPLVVRVYMKPPAGTFAAPYNVPITVLSSIYAPNPQPNPPTTSTARGLQLNPTTWTNYVALNLAPNLLKSALFIQ